MEKFRDLYAGQPVNIIGKGPSLQYLRAEHIGPGPVITIRQAILAVEEIDIPNPVFSMQKDGGDRKRVPYTLSPDCDHSPDGCDSCGGMVRPRRGATLLIHRHESLYCFPDYSPRHVFDWRELGLPGNRFSLILAIKIGQLMGCTKFRFVSCDSYTNASVDAYIPGVGLIIWDQPIYLEQVRATGPYLKGLNCEWITPAKKAGAGG